MTDVRGLVEAQAIDSVCTADDRVAIYLATSTGIVLVHAPLKDFIAKCRAPFDHHGRPFPNLARRDRLEAEMQADAEASLPKGAPSAHQPESLADVRAIGPFDRGHRFTSQETKTLRAAWGCFIADPSLSANAVADHLQVSLSTVQRYFAKFAAEPGAPALKPNGRL